MGKMIFVNLPVRDLPKAKDFYAAIGAVNNPQFTDETAACMVFSDAINVMLLTHAKWATFTKKPIVDSRSASEVILAISCDTREAVDEMLKGVNAAGGRADVNPQLDYGFMLNRSFEDPDGHIWEAVWLDPKGMPG